MVPSGARHATARTNSAIFSFGGVRQAPNGVPDGCLHPLLNRVRTDAQAIGVGLPRRRLAARVSGPAVVRGASFGDEARERRPATRLSTLSPSRYQASIGCHGGPLAPRGTKASVRYTVASMRAFVILTTRKQVVVALVHTWSSFSSPCCSRAFPCGLWNSASPAGSWALTGVYLVVTGILAVLVAFAGRSERLYFALCAASAALGLARQILGDPRMRAAVYIGLRCWPAPCSSAFCSCGATPRPRRKRSCRPPPCRLRCGGTIE